MHPRDTRTLLAPNPGPVGGLPDGGSSGDGVEGSDISSGDGGGSNNNGGGGGSDGGGGGDWGIGGWHAFGPSAGGQVGEKAPPLVQRKFALNRHQPQTQNDSNI